MDSIASLNNATDAAMIQTITTTPVAVFNFHGCVASAVTPGANIDPDAGTLGFPDPSMPSDVGTLGTLNTHPDDGSHGDPTPSEENPAGAVPTGDGVVPHDDSEVPQGDGTLSKSEPEDPLKAPCDAAPYVSDHPFLSSSCSIHRDNPFEEFFNALPYDPDTPDALYYFDPGEASADVILQQGEDWHSFHLSVNSEA